MARGKSRPPFVLTDEVIEEIRRMAAHSITQEEMIVHFDVSRSVWFRKAAKDPRVEKAIRQGYVTTKRLCVSKLMEQIKAGKLNAIKFWLICQGGWRQHTEVTGSLFGNKAANSEEIPKSFGDDPNEASKTYLKIMG